MHYVLLPGLHGTQVLFDDFVAAAPAGCLVTRIEYPVGGPQDSETLVRFVVAHLPPGPVTLIAESFGGLVGIALAAQHPMRVASLVLVGSFARSPLGIPASLVPGAALRALTYWLWPARVLLAGPRRSERTDALLREALPKLPYETFAARVRTILESDVRALLPSLRARVLYLQASRDLLVPAQRGRELVARTPSARLRVLDGPHMLLAERPRACWQAIIDEGIAAPR